jgi:hypothetical protein
MQAIDILNAKLRGEAILSFHAGDVWTLYIGGYYLSAQNIISPDEERLNEWFQANYASFHNAVDQGNISKSTSVAAHLRKPINRIELAETYSLTMHFEDDSTLLIPTNEDIADWQWCLNLTGADPYQEYLVACFWEGEISITESAANP